jgi:hypothetical protein
MQCEGIVGSTGARCGCLAKYCYNDKLTCYNHTPKCAKSPGNLIVPQETSEEPVVHRMRQRKREIIPITGALLNDFPCKVVYFGISFKSAEDAFEATKYYYKHSDPIINEYLYQRVCDIVNHRNDTIFEAKGETPIRHDWHELKERFLFDILEAKFIPSNATAYEELVNTMDHELVAPDNDISYTNCTLLPRVLMMVRSKLFGATTD